MFKNFQVSLYGKETSETIVDRDDFKNIAPSTIFDCSKQNDSLKYASVDVRLEFETTAAFRVSTSAYCLILRHHNFQYCSISGEVQIAV